MSRKTARTAHFYGQEGFFAKNFLPVKVKIGVAIA